MLRFKPSDCEGILKFGRDRIFDYNLAGDGREHDVHITVLYGFPLDTDPVQLKDYIRSYGEIVIELGNVDKFKASESRPDSDVVKISVKPNKRLTELHNALREGFNVDNPWGSYNPHVTLAYVQPGKHENLVGDSTFNGERYILKDYVYSADYAKKWSLTVGSDSRVICKKAHVFLSNPYTGIRFQYPVYV